MTFDEWLALDHESPEQMLVNAYHWAKKQSQFRKTTVGATQEKKWLVQALNQYQSRFNDFLCAYREHFEEQNRGQRSLSAFNWLTGTLRALDDYLIGFRPQLRWERFHPTDYHVEAYDETCYVLLPKAANPYDNKTMRFRRNTLGSHPIQLLHNFDPILQEAGSYSLFYHCIRDLYLSDEDEQDLLDSVSEQDEFFDRLKHQCEDETARFAVSSLIYEPTLDILFQPRSHDPKQATFVCEKLTDKENTIQDLLRAHVREAGEQQAMLLAFPELMVSCNEFKHVQDELKTLFKEGGWEAVPTIVVAGSFHERRELQSLYNACGVCVQTSLEGECCFNISKVLSGDGRLLWEQHKWETYYFEQYFKDEVPQLFVQALEDVLQGSSQNVESIKEFVEDHEVEGPLHFVDGPMGRMVVAICSSLFHGTDLNPVEHGRATLLVSPSMSDSLKLHHQFADAICTSNGAAMVCANTQFSFSRVNLEQPSERSFVSLPQQKPPDCEVGSCLRVLHAPGEPWEQLLLSKGSLH
ncbi:MAG: hypothetical protein EP343_29065 [Deltaproteobacteria bacterium]|nr:MAG: hypothetical protein EP343_29065 [Deltaproteobacteria bacterium]